MCEEQVAEAYLQVLGRLPDESGLRTYTRCANRRGIEAVIRRLKNSEEYRFKQAYNPAPFNEFIEKQTEILKDESFTMSQDATKCAVIVEGRTFETLTTLVKLTLRYLPHDWGLMVICPIHNLEYNKNKLADIQNVVYKTVESLETVEDYNNLLLSLYFWETLLAKVKHALIFQTDSFLLRRGIDSFLDYDYIGARIPCGKVMNGGLSLRKTETMKDILKKYSPCKYENEDVFFSRCIEKFPSTLEQDSFSVEQCVVDTQPLGVHKAWFYNRKTYCGHFEV